MLTGKQSVDDNSGAVYVFTRDDTTWTQRFYVKAANAVFGDEFGNRLALDGDTLAVGAPFDSSDCPSCGALWLVAQDETGSVQTELRFGRGSGGEFSSINPYDAFGSAVAAAPPAAGAATCCRPGSSRPLEVRSVVASQPQERAVDPLARASGPALFRVRPRPPPTYREPCPMRLAPRARRRQDRPPKLEIVGPVGGHGHVTTADQPHAPTNSRAVDPADDFAGKLRVPEIAQAVDQQKKDAITAAILVFVISGSVMAVACGALYYSGQAYEKLGRIQDAIRMYREIINRPGIDLVLKTAQLLTKHTELDFEWNIIGVSRWPAERKIGQKHQ